ncbi:tail protein X [uncultured Alistipes sp.]|uniref:tail protein X n=2 Tax=uncultured Alistipes sp. TaxID=538949 RepID=UPI00338F4EE1
MRLPWLVSQERKKQGIDMASFNYTTVEGDRIDTLSARFYGGNRGIAIIADANPAVPLDAIFPLGTVLVIPIVEDSRLAPNTDLPPWKR